VTALREPDGEPNQVGRDYKLTSTEVACLLQVTMTAPWRSMTWTGSLSAIADDTRMTWRAVKKAI
jgi:hypothetical protein